MTVQERVEAAWAMCVSSESVDSSSAEKQPIRTPSLSLTPEGINHNGIELIDKDVEQSVDGGSDDEGSVASTVDGDQKHVLLLSSQAISSARHRVQIRDHVVEMLELIESLQSKANQLTPSSHTDLSSLTKRPRPPHSPSRSKSGYQSLERHDTDLRASERLADEIDSEVHRLQYTVDKCRRSLLPLFSTLIYMRNCNVIDADCYKDPVQPSKVSFLVLVSRSKGSSICSAHSPRCNAQLCTCNRP